MAATFISPSAGDETRIGDAVELLKKTGYPISKSTLERQCRARGVKLIKYDRANWASWTDLLKVHRDWVDES
ncbi:hypothetical protein [Streptomyces pilosus]|uniref:hypothetical protein n=1 Tax=Streptomyces pilosus TaxID=28893 RepID=UPI00363A9112